ncbi:MAG: sulfotransferase family protein [Actinomycetes bacterium]
MSAGSANGALPQPPNLLVVGVAKAATTSLFRYLAQHPDIFPADLKELRYFIPLRYNEPLEPFESYTAHFRGRSRERYAVEATPGYFPGGRAVAEGIDRTLPDARVIVSLRDPSDRCWSWFRFVKSRVRIPRDMTFDSYLDRCEELHRRGVDGEREHQPFWGMGGGCYASWLPSWAEVFEDRLRVVYFDDLVKDPQATVSNLCQWLELDTEPTTRFDYAVDNQSEQYRLKALQLAALGLNRRAERFFTRHRVVKRSLKSVYDLTNSRRQAVSHSAESWARLEEFYRPHSEALSRQLTELGMTLQPPWVPQANP